MKWKLRVEGKGKWEESWLRGEYEEKGDGNAERRQCKGKKDKKEE